MIAQKRSFHILLLKILRQTSGYANIVYMCIIYTYILYIMFFHFFHFHAQKSLCSCCKGTVLV